MKKSGAEIYANISIREAYTEPNQDKDPEWNSLISQMWYSEDEIKEFLDILEEVIVQCCTDESVKNASTPRLDSMALSSYAEALRFLDKHGRVTIISEYGRRIIASLNKQEVPNSSQG